MQSVRFVQMRKQEMEEWKQGRAVTKTVPDASRGKKMGRVSACKSKKGRTVDCKWRLSIKKKNKSVKEYNVNKEVYKVCFSGTECLKSVQSSRRGPPDSRGWRSSWSLLCIIIHFLLFVELIESRIILSLQLMSLKVNKELFNTD